MLGRFWIHTEYGNKNKNNQVKIKALDEKLLRFKISMTFWIISETNDANHRRAFKKSLWRASTFSLLCLVNRIRDEINYEKRQILVLVNFWEKNPCYHVSGICVILMEREIGGIFQWHERSIQPETSAINVAWNQR